MKKTFILMLGLMLSSVSFARVEKDTTNNAPIVATLSVVKQGKIALSVSEADEVAFIKLKDEKGNLIYDNKVYLKKGIMQPFDISELSPGKYDFVISTGAEVITETFVIKSADQSRKVQIL
jgi:hypothetical protein